MTRFAFELSWVGESLGVCFAGEVGRHHSLDNGYPWDHIRAQVIAKLWTVEYFRDSVADSVLTYWDNVPRAGIGLRVQEAVHRRGQVTPWNHCVALLFRLNGIEHLREPRRIILVPTPIPTLDLLRMEMEIEQNSGSLDKCPYENVCSEQVSLPNEFPD